MKSSRKGPVPLTRRRFVTLMAAGSAALVTPGGAAAAAAAVARPRRAGAAGETLAPSDRKELLRQQASTRTTLDVIRKHAMPPGTEMAAVFSAMRPRRGKA